MLITSLNSVGSSVCTLDSVNKVVSFKDCDMLVASCSNVVKSLDVVISSVKTVLLSTIALVSRIDFCEFVWDRTTVGITFCRVGVFVIA